MAHKIAYARVSTADQNPDLQLDALAAEGYLKIYTDTAYATVVGFVSSSTQCGEVWLVLDLGLWSRSGGSGLF